jgi:hypothetical protein
MTTKVSQNFTYKLNGKEYSVQYKKPTIGDQIKIGQQTATLKGGFPTLDPTSEGLAFKISTLNSVIVNKPADLDFLSLDSDDWDTVIDMYADYEKFVFFRGENPKAAVKT